MPVAELSSEGVILDANDHFLTMTGYRLDELRGAHHRTLCDVHYASSSEYKSFWQSILAGENLVVETRRVHKSERAIWCQSSYSPVVGEDGSIIKIVYIAKDVTDSNKGLAALDFRLRPIVGAPTMPLWG